MRCLFLMPCIAMMALLLLLAPTHTKGPVYLLPVNRRVRRQYTPPLRHRHGYARGPNPHSYRIWRPSLLLLYIVCFFHTPTAPTTAAPCRYHAPVSITTVTSPYNTRYNTNWVLQCGDVHPNPGHRRIYQLRQGCRDVRGPPISLFDIEEYAQHLVVNTNRRYDSLDDATTAKDHDMKLASWNIQGAQGSVSLQRWASTLHLISQCRIDLCGIQEYNPCVPKPEAATTALNNDYKCYAAPGTEPRIAFVVRNSVVPHILETLYSPNGLAGAIRIQLPNSPRRTIACVYSKFNQQDKQEVDLFLQSLRPYDIIMGDYNDDMWSPNPTRPWQEDLANGVFLDPLHASSQPPDPRQYYTRIPRHGRPRRLDAILIKQQIPNIPWTYYDTIQMPISDHALVLLGIRWRIGAPDPPRRKPQPTVAKWYTKQFQRFANTISTLPVTNNDPPLRTARRILSAIAHAARPRQPTRAQTTATASWSETTDPKARLREYGEIQEQHIRRQIGKLRRAAVHKLGYFYKMVKRWRTGLIAQDTPQPPIGGTQYVLNHFAGDPTYDEDACRQLIQKHVRHRTWNTTTPTYEEYLRCLRAPKNKSAGPDGVPPHLLRHLPDHVQRQLYQAIVAVWNGQHIPVAWLQSRVVLIYKKKDPQDPRNYRPIYVSTAIYSILTRLLLTRISEALTPGLLDIQHGATQGRNTTTLATKLLNDLHVEDGYVALLDVAKAFPSVPRPMLTGIVKEAGAPENIIRMLGEIYHHTPAVLTLHGKDLPIRPTRGMKEGCPLSPTLFLLYYDILLRETMERCPRARLYVFVDDIAVRAPTKEALLHTLDTLHDVAYTMGLRFNKDKTEVCHWAKDYDLRPITWRQQLIPVRPPIMTYVGHVLAHPTQEDTAWDMVTTQLHHDVAAYRTLPLNAYEKVAIINAVLIPRWTYRGLFLGNRTRMAY